METVLISVRSLFADPNCSSAANVDASVEFRNNLEAFTARVKALVDKSIAELPEGFVVRWSVCECVCVCVCCCCCCCCC